MPTESPATFTYANLPASSVVAASFTLSRGVTPSIATIRTADNAGFVDATGTLTLSHRGSSMSLANCAVVVGSRRAFCDRNGRWLFEFDIADRRRLWQHKLIDGRFNTRLPDCRVRLDSRWPGEMKTLRQLASYVLDAMGETAYDVTDVPATLYPPVDWRQCSASAALDRIADIAGCVVCLGVDDRVRLKRRGSGASMPGAGTALFAAHPWTPASPAGVTAYAGPTRVQATLLLEPVGMESDATRAIKPIADLSYAPAAGWSTQHPESFAGVSPSSRPYAMQSVWRWYRVAVPEAGLSIPGVVTPITSLAQILPLHPTLVDTAATLPGDALGEISAYVTGTVYQLGDLPVNADARYVNSDFTLDCQRGLVCFPYPVYKLNGSGMPTAADLSLTVSFHVRQANGEHLRRSVRSTLSGGVDADATIVVPHLHDVVGCSTNSWTTIEAELLGHADAIAMSMAATTCDDNWFEGLQFLSPDGAIAQVGWRCGAAKPSMTRVCRGVEADIFQPREQARRARVRVDYLWELSR